MTLKLKTRDMKEIKFNVVDNEYVFRVRNKETGEVMVMVQKAESEEAAKLRIPDEYEFIEVKE